MIAIILSCSGGIEMPDVLIRDVDNLVLNSIKAKAKRRNRSLQTHMKIIMRKEAEQPEIMSEIELLRKFRASLRPQKIDSLKLLRQDRNR